MNKKFIITIILVLIFGLVSFMYFQSKVINIETSVNDKLYLPLENEEHLATWLIWPHEFTYGKTYKNSIEPIWINMAKAIFKGEKLKIVAYDESEKERIKRILNKNNIDLSNVSFFIEKNDDVWARDTGPLFAYDSKGEICILDFKFNGWGEKVPYNNDKKLAYNLSEKLNIKYLESTLTLEPGAIEMDGNGVLVATESSIINNNRNPKFGKNEINKILKNILPIDKIIWIKGNKNLDITDMHIDGFFKFYNNNTIITLSNNDLSEWGLNSNDIKIMNQIKNINDLPYEIITLPLTKFNVILENGKNLNYKGSYINYYISNKSIIIPMYNDPNDEVAKTIFEDLYPNKEIIGIDCRNLYQYGGMIHCVTQQQPLLK